MKVSLRLSSVRLASAALTTAVVFGCLGLLGAAGTKGSPRERLLLNADWRFQKGDPAGADSSNLLYDVRPEPRALGERPAEFTEAAEKLGPATHPVLKPFILPTGNRFIKDPKQRFARPEGDPGGGLPYAQPGLDDSGWTLVNLPHDWAIQGPFSSSGGGGMGRLPSAGVAWYRKKLEIPAADSGKRIFLDVDGAMSYATVWLNGRLAGGWPYGYASWRVDLTPYVTPGGSNQLAIRLDNPPDSSRWYPGGGLYRNVWLVKTGPVHIAQWGTWLTTPQVSRTSATIDLEVTVENDSKAGAKITISTAVYRLDAEGRPSGNSVAAIEPATRVMAAESTAVVKGSVTVANPRLWGPLRDTLRHSVCGHQAGRSLCQRRTHSDQGRQQSS
jgi:beta-galactosidase